MNINFENIKNSVVLLRADLNETIDTEGKILGTDRIDASIGTIHELLARNNKVVLISHLSESKESLSSVANYIKKSFTNLLFIQSLNIEEIKTEIKNNLDTNLFLLENLRSFGDSLEENNDKDFAKYLSELAEYFVYDAFSVAHRAHASTVSISEFLPHCLGPIAQKEFDNLSKLYESHENMLVIMGGAKLSTKLPIISHFLKNGAKVFLGGAMTHPILKLRGIDIKNSKTEEIELGEDIVNNTNLMVPSDFVWDTENNSIMDAGEETLVNIKKEINEAKSIMWNGPLGVYENGYEAGTRFVLENLNKIDKFVVVGGGDTLSAIAKLKPDFSCSYISLSGGAMLEFLATGTLVGIEANR